MPKDPPAASSRPDTGPARVAANDPAPVLPAAGGAAQGRALPGAAPGQAVAAALSSAALASLALAPAGKAQPDLAPRMPPELVPQARPGADSAELPQPVLPQPAAAKSAAAGSGAGKPPRRARRGPRMASPAAPAGVDFASALNLPPRLLLDLRLQSLPAPATETRERIQVRPYLHGRVGGPDPAQMPMIGRITIRGRARCSFRDTWREGADRLPLLKGHYLYGGPLKSHFGHVMVDSLSRLHAYDPARHDGVVFAFEDGQPLSPWVWRILGLFGLPKDRVRLVETPVLVERLDFALPGSTLGQGPVPAWLDYLDTLAWRRSPPCAEVPRRIYLGRLHIPHRGTLLGESYFSALLEQAGFVSLRPETMGVEEQARQLELADEVVFLEGSSIYSVELLQKSRARFWMIPRRAGGEALFRPHIEPRAPFTLLGDDRAVRRLTSPDGTSGPSWPSRSLAPLAIHADLVRHGLIAPGSFDAAAFRAAEAADARASARDEPGLGLPAILDWLHSAG